MLLNQCGDQTLLFLAEYKPFEWLDRPLDVDDSIDREAACIVSEPVYYSRSFDADGM